MTGTSVRPATRADIAEARALFEEYERGIGVDLSFQNFAEELETLPGEYAAPGGVLLLAFANVAGRPLGCVAVRRISEADCEMKRLFLREDGRGKGLGEALARAAVGWAREAGYKRMLLDTLPTMGAAQRLYERLGFAEIEAYRHNPVPGARFLALTLARLSSDSMVELREPLEELIHFPRQFTAGTTFPRASEIRLYDTSLRDGEQTPGVAFAPEQKFELACMLSDAGVHMLDVGFPSAAPSERKSLQLILDAKKKGRIKSEIVVMCRSSAKDIDVTLDFLAGIGAKPHDASFFVFTSGSDLHLKYKIGKTLLGLEGRKPEEWLDLPVSFYREANIRMSTKAIEHARSRGVEVVEFGGEDGSRADVNYLIELAGACYKAGGARYAYPDTVGYFAPEGVDFYIPKIVAAFPDKPLVIHFHNDFGLGAYNTVRALHHGATIPTVTVNGIGERAGNAPLHTTVMILKELYGVTIPGFRYDMLWELKRKVEEMSGLPVAGGEPIIGHNVFTHETGIHTAGITIHPAIYQVVQPEMVGGQLRFLFGKHSGAVAIEAVLKRNEAKLLRGGVDITPKLVQTLLKLIKDIRERRAANTDHAEEIRQYYSNLNNLGLTEEDLVSYALVLGPELK